VTDLDSRILFFLYSAGGGALTRLALVLSAVGSGWVTLGLIPLLRWPRWRRLVGTLGVALGAGAGLVALLKAVIGRPRPCFALPGVHALCSPPSDPSFPSGHAFGGFAFAAFVVFTMYTGDEVRPQVRRILTPTVVMLAIGIAWSRVYLGVHFPADVVVGGALGVVTGLCAGWLYRRSTPVPSR
jgi:undecaprenyl-diphosphatase